MRVSIEAEVSQLAIKNILRTSPLPSLSHSAVTVVPYGNDDTIQQQNPLIASQMCAIFSLCLVSKNTALCNMDSIECDIGDIIINNSMICCYIRLHIVAFKAACKTTLQSYEMKD